MVPTPRAQDLPAQAGFVRLSRRSGLAAGRFRGAHRNHSQAQHTGTTHRHNSQAQLTRTTQQENVMASLTPIILFGALFLLALYLGGAACDTAANARKKQ